MEKKHPRAEDNSMWPCCDEPQPQKRVKQEHTEAEDAVRSANGSPLERLNRPVIDQGLIYTERLEVRTARILVLNPGSESDEIRCDLIQKEDLTQASLGKVSPYEAVSYVWGEEQDPDFIILCGSRFAVTRSLAEALRYLRLPKSDRMLWVDAICINQYDEKEKEAQVLSMHRIYKFAKEVIAWLGPPDGNSKEAYSIMNMMQEQSIVPVCPVFTIQISKEGTINENNPFRNLMARPYWSRAWIVQEMMSAQSLVIQCGYEVVPYSRLEEVYPPKKLVHARIDSGESRSVPIRFQGDPEVKILRIDSERMCSNRFLDSFLDRQCRERHDNIFAFLNLLSDNVQREIQVCYKTDIRKLVHITARAIIRSTQSLHIIVIRGRQRPPSARGSDKWQLNMPSWCPYLATPYECCSLGPQPQPSLFAQEAVFSFTSNKLRVRGFAIGKVSQTISRHIPHELGATAWWDESDTEREQKHYLKCLYLGLHGMPHDKHTLLMSVEATTRTLLAGQSDEIFDVRELLGSKSRDPEGAMAVLRKIWNNGKSRLVCSFRLSNTAKRALHSSKAAPAAWINRVALVPRTVRQGDVICTILGCTTPVVLRKAGKHYRVMGEAYVDTSAMGRFIVTVKLRDFILG
jgi:hypothetical protein